MFRFGGVPALVSKIGREATDFVLLVMNEKRRKFGDVQQGQIGGRDASAAAGQVGRTCSC